jgi:hypothetical protein
VAPFISLVMSMGLVPLRSSGNPAKPFVTVGNCRYRRSGNDADYILLDFDGDINLDEDVPDPDGVLLRVIGISDLVYLRCAKSGIDLVGRLPEIHGASSFHWNPGYGPLLNISSVLIAPWVTDIRDGAFPALTNLTFSESSTLKGLDGFTRGKFKSIAIPDSVEVIGPSGFAECKQLKNVSFGCQSRLRQIEGFRDCTKLESISFPDSLTIVGYFAFRGCTALQSFQTSSNSRLTKINGFESCLGFVSFTIPIGLECTGEKAFRLCRRLKVIEFPDDCHIREVQGFVGIGIESLRLPPSIEVLRPRAFAECPALWVLVTPNAPRLQTLAGFSGCGKLSALGVTSGEWPPKGTWDLTHWPDLRVVRGFDKCAIVSVLFPESVEKVDGFTFCGQLETVVFPRHGKLVWISGFNSTDIEKLDLPASVVELHGFSNCTDLRSVVFDPESHLRVISGLSHCAIQTICLPKSVTELKQGRFGTLISHAFRLLLLDPESRLMAIEASFSTRSTGRPFFIAAPEPYLASRRRHLHARLRATDSRKLIFCKIPASCRFLPVHPLQ